MGPASPPSQAALAFSPQLLSAARALSPPRRGIRASPEWKARVERERSGASSSRLHRRGRRPWGFRRERGEGKEGTTASARLAEGPARHRRGRENAGSGEGDGEGAGARRGARARPRRPRGFARHAAAAAASPPQLVRRARSSSWLRRRRRGEGDGGSEEKRKGSTADFSRNIWICRASDRKEKEKGERKKKKKKKKEKKIKNRKII